MNYNEIVTALIVLALTAVILRVLYELVKGLDHSKETEKPYAVNFELVEEKNVPTVIREPNPNGVKIKISHPLSLNVGEFRKLMSMISDEEAGWYFKACDSARIRFYERYSIIVEKAGHHMHRNPKDRDKAIQWAREVLNNKSKYVILDTETSGVNKNDVILQIGIIDMDGNELLNSLVKPTKRKRISQEVTSIHGITMKELKDQPTFTDLLPKIDSIIWDKTVIIYNEDFDRQLITQTCEQDECGDLSIKTTCAMLQYSKFCGEWNYTHYDYKWQRLPSADHSAVGDCLATLAVIKKMAETKMSIEVVEDGSMV